MEFEDVVYSRHAVERMFTREITTSAVETVLREGEEIDRYPDDRPYPSFLILGFVEGMPIHVAAALDAEAKRCYVITAYRPGPALWEPDFSRRKR